MLLIKGEDFGAALVVAPPACSYSSALVLKTSFHCLVQKSPWDWAQLMLEFFFELECIPLCELLPVTTSLSKHTHIHTSPTQLISSLILSYVVWSDFWQSTFN